MYIVFPAALQNIQIDSSVSNRVALWSLKDSWEWEKSETRCAFSRYIKVHWRVELILSNKVLLEVTLGASTNRPNYSGSDSINALSCGL